MTTVAVGTRRRAASTIDRRNVDPYGVGPGGYCRLDQSARPAADVEHPASPSRGRPRPESLR